MYQEKYKHSYPHCWRHKAPIIFRATQQWFIGMDSKNKNNMSLRDLANKSASGIKFYPEWGKSRLEAMMNNRPDWCVSRQRNWGVPIPIYVHNETKVPHPKTLEFLDIVANEIEEENSRYNVLHHTSIALLLDVGTSLFLHCSRMRHCIVCFVLFRVIFSFLFICCVERYNMS